MSGTVQFDQEAKRSDFTLEIVELVETGIISVGKWNTSHGLFINRTSQALTAEDEGILKNQSFIVITCLVSTKMTAPYNPSMSLFLTFKTEPYGMLKESQTQLYGNERFEGFAIDLIAELAAMENFNYTFHIREDKQNGAKNIETGKWTGMIGDVMEGVSIV